MAARLDTLEVNVEHIRKTVENLHARMNRLATREELLDFEGRLIQVERHLGLIK